MFDAGARRAVEATRFGDVRWFPEIDSTNRYLLDEARVGAPEGVVAVADHQTAGRGRLGRAWTAPPDASLLASILLRPQLPPEYLHLVSAAVSLAAADACRAVSGAEPELKWPNDLLLVGRKLAGVLAEADLGPGPSGGPAGPAVVVGIGINVNWPEELPAELADLATSLNRVTGRTVDRAALLVEMLIGLEARYALLSGAEAAAGAGAGAGGRAALAAEYRRRSATIGQPVRVELHDETFTGTATDISDEGHLMVSTDTCLRAVTAGDVVHLRPL